MRKYSGLKNTFFSKDRVSALKHLKKLAEKDSYYKNKTVRLNKKQVKHSSANNFSTGGTHV